MSVNGKFSDIGYDDLMTVADQFGVQRARSALKDIRSALQAWPRVVADAGLSQAKSTAVGEQFHLEALG